MGEEIERQLDAGGSEVLLFDVLWAVCDAMNLEGSDHSELMDSDSDIFQAAWTDTVVVMEYEIGGEDVACVVEFGDGLAFLAFDRNPFRDREHLFVSQVDPADRDSIRSQAVDEMFVGAGETLGMTPSGITVDSDDTKVHMRWALQHVLGGVERPDLDLLEVPEDTQERYALVDAYLDEVLWNRREPGGTIGASDADEGSGMLLSELLRLDDKSIAADLDRIEMKLRKLHEELEDNGGP
ncbi:MAG: hypothetical protein M3132_13575 [Actinomycetia bacterium]|nr:hypothetical protein [Actinomycetes bacterium]